MNNPEHIERLRTSVAEGLDYLTSGLDASFKRYVSDTIIPILSEVLKELCSEIEQFHIFTDTALDCKQPPEYVIHYTTVATVVSMLQAQAIKRKHGDIPDKEQGQQGTSLRLYDSAHFNDPDDGTYLGRHLSQSGQHDWVIPSTRTHAYIASFIIPDDDPDSASDDLVFWRTYGRDGEGCSLKLRTPTAHVRRVLYTAEELGCTERLLCPVLAGIPHIGSLQTQWAAQTRW